MLTGSKLLEHQESTGFDMPDCGGHDQREDTWRDQEDIQHQERLHARGRGGGSKGEPVGIRVDAHLLCWMRVAVCMWSICFQNDNGGQSTLELLVVG